MKHVTELDCNNVMLAMRVIVYFLAPKVLEFFFDDF